MLNISRLRLGLNAYENLPFAPSAAADLSVWHKQTNIVSGASWVDSSGNGNDLTGAGGSNSPTVSNGRMVFDSASVQSMAWGTDIDFVPATIYVVGKFTGAATGQILSNSVANVQFRYEAAGTQISYRGSPVSLDNPDRTAVSTTVWHRGKLITTASSNPGVALDGTAIVANGDTNGTTKLHTTGSGSGFFNRVGLLQGVTNPLDAELAEIIIFNRALSSAEQTSVQKYLDTVIAKMNALDA